MGNAGSNQGGIHHSSGHRDRHHRHSKDHHPPSPGKESGAGQAFVFDKKPLIFQSSHDEEEAHSSKVAFIKLPTFKLLLNMY